MDIEYKPPDGDSHMNNLSTPDSANPVYRLKKDPPQPRLFFLPDAEASNKYLFILLGFSLISPV